ncbi:MAG: tRNA (adenosine(37)-N6)-threonylcarbamoyltransferase complex dimerization subunit type 1 TsaB [Candidatus Blackburnbacteria bacterium RIFCSPHIGHO2_01_FULL_43_15b]|uniref:tRNA (Adenosine(37)-N6)-threonylcarbamoyltransferase complex dimerization subunit type 1 TsaB n=1 Tax=Candidatus Blackburnbacteria bacterium RIFCSPHIGHO2_01_FULL_43_15b TaxID=1797513 RepID=A0A1G1UZY4_9BACT|nr:MAG: tRNA (adenosine(37)-N6)-threonylcarbamoyltransferase complex dimerization subunit type 1 TsaB [Candidatus Blackburnbacteria bacterium RIFCSPHIGHO2_01_FULL_43_15b]
MILYIDTSNSEKIKVRIGEMEIEKDSRERKSQTLLETIDEALTAQGCSLQDMEGVEVNLGPGSFTGLRVGVSVANALGYSLGIPVNGQNVGKAGTVAPEYY